MRLRIAVVLALALAAGVTGSASATTEPARSSPVDLAAPPLRPDAPPPRPLSSTHLQACAGGVRPDRAVISGAITAETLLPTEAARQIDRQLAEMRRLVESRGGKLVTFERVRSVRPAVAERASIRPEELPFVMMQRLEADFPADVAVDPILEKLLQSGLDRFGRDVRGDRPDAAQRIVVTYRVSRIEEELERLHRRCRQEALEQWCAQPDAPRASCSLPGGDRERQFRTLRFVVQTQPLLTRHGAANSYAFNRPWDPSQLAAFELVGHVAVELRATLTLAPIFANGR